MSSDAGDQGFSDQPKLGAPFSQVYLRPSAPMKDNARFRHRLAAYVVNNTNPWYLGELTEFVENQVGIIDGGRPWTRQEPKLAWFLLQDNLYDVLDAITAIAEFYDNNWPDRVLSWHEIVEQLFHEEGLGYSLDEKCGVRYQVDMEFERVRLAAVAHLGSPRYKAVLHDFEAAYRAIEGNPPNTKLAVRSMFEAIETLFRLMVGPKAKLLGSPEVKQFLPPMIRSLYTDPLAANTMIQLVNGLADWVNGLQAYRHGQAVEEPCPPPMEAAVAALQTGSAYLRLLIELDRKVQSGSEGT